MNITKLRKTKKLKHYEIILGIICCLTMPIFFSLGGALNSTKKTDLTFPNAFNQYDNPNVAGTLTRTGYPVILDNETAGGALWTALKNHHVDNIRIAYYDGSSWVLVPFQLDEMGYFRSYTYETGKHVEGDISFSGGTQYTEQTNWGHFISDHRYVGDHVDSYAASATELSQYDCEMEFWAARAAEYYTDEPWSDGDAPQAEPPVQPDPGVYPYNLEQPGGAWEQLPDRIDYDDEVSFYAYNGDQVDASNWWNAASYPDRYELAITDPVSGGGTGYMYLYYNDDMGTPPPAEKFFMPNGPSDDQVAWNSGTQTVTGENYQYSYDSTADQAFLASIVVEGQNMFTEWNKEWQQLQLDIQRAGSTFGAGAVDSQADTCTGTRMGTWSGTFYDELITDIGYGTTMDFDLQNLAAGVGDPIFPGQDSDYTNGHRPWNQPLPGGQNHRSSGYGGWWDEYFFLSLIGIGNVASWDDGMDHDGNYGLNSEHAPFVRGLITFANGHQAAVDGPIRVIIDQFSLRQVQFTFVDNEVNSMEYEEGLRFDRYTTSFFANEMREVEYLLDLDYSPRGAGDPNLNVYMNVYYMFYDGAVLHNDIRSNNPSVWLGQAPSGYGYIQCDPVYATTRTCTPNGGNTGEDYLANDAGPNPSLFDESSPIVTGNPLSDWRYVKTNTAGAWTYIPVQEFSQIFSGDTYSSLQWYWQDVGGFTEMSLYGNDGSTNTKTGLMNSLRTYFDDGSMSDTECKNQYVFSKEGFSIAITAQTAPSDTEPPVWTTAPVDETIELGTGVSQDLEATDPSTPITYSISGADASSFDIDPNTGLLINSVPLSVGTYDITVSATDSYSNSLDTPITITVQDTIAPIWMTAPVDETIELGTGVNQDVEATDLSIPITYSISGADASSFDIDPVTGVLTNSVALSVGTYNITASATDVESNALNTPIIITVQDTGAPTWVVAPVDETIEFGDGINQDVDANDLSTPITYSISGPDAGSFTIDPNTGVLTNSVALSEGTYDITVSATDAESNSINTPITITVQDTIAPTWTTPPVDDMIELGNGINQDVDANDLSTPIAYSISGADASSFDIDPVTGVLTNSVALGVATYDINVIATDSAITSNSISTPITITVQDTGAPTWVIAPVDEVIELGDGINQDVDAIDPSTPVTYSISGADAGSFTIDPNTGVLTNSVALSEGTYDITVSATDAESNSINSPITITVQDTIAPTWVVAPVDETIELGNGINQDVDANDLSTPITYSISGVDASFFTINIGTGVLTNSGPLTEGTYNINVIATDAAATPNSISTPITITVQDSTAPTWVVAPVDETIELGDGINQDVDANDLSTPITYSISGANAGIFDIDLNTGVLTNSVALAEGTYNIIVSATDAAATPNSISTPITITVQDTTAPTWTTAPVSQSIVLGNGVNQDVDANDLSTPITYSISGPDAGSFTIDSVTGVLTNSTQLGEGTYDITVIATDAAATPNSISTPITITVAVDEPYWNPTPQDQTVEFGDPFSYTVNAEDADGVVYSISGADAGFFDIDSTGEITNAGALAEDMYSITVRAEDATNPSDYVEQAITITVQDTIAPTWTTAPVDETIELGTGVNQHVEATDLSTPITYSISGANAGSFTIDPYTGVLTNSVALSVGTYDITVSATDAAASPNSISTPITITVQDTGAPTWVVAPVDETIEFKDGVNQDVDATDPSTPVTYSISGPDAGSFTIDPNTGVLTNSVALSEGTYDITVSATDAESNSINTPITITVQDTIAPTWTTPPVDEMIELGNGINQELDANDLSTPITYSISGPDAGSFTIDPNTGVLTNSGPLTEGTYNINVIATDAAATPNNISTPITITVQDTTAPTWTTAPVSQSIILGNGLNQDVEANDLSTPISYSISGPDAGSFDIDPVTGVLTNSTPLGEGTYDITVIATDAAATPNSISTPITITVAMGEPYWNPTPQDQTVELGDPFSYTVNAEDADGVVYSISGAYAGFFNIDSTGEITNDGALAEDVYSITVRAEDATNPSDYIEQAITITVQDTTAPTWVVAPVDETIELGDGVNQDVDATDPSTPVAYSISGPDAGSFTIDPNTGVLTNSGPLTEGTYNINVIATDAAATPNSISIPITITVQDTTAPTWVVAPVDETIELGNGINQGVDANDLSTPITYSISGPDAGSFTIDPNTGVLTNSVALSEGMYDITVSATDAESNSINSPITITVQDTIAPTWTTPPVDETIELGNGINQDVDANDFSTPISYSISGPDAGSFDIDSVTGVLTNSTPLGEGTYDITVIATDAAATPNSISTPITITVAMGEPYWNPTPQDQTVELGDPFSYTVNAEDADGVVYSISGAYAGFFNIDSTGEITNDGALAEDVYSITVRAEDATNPSDYIEQAITITVQDTIAPAWTNPPVDQVVAPDTEINQDVNANDLSTPISYLISGPDAGSFDIDSVTGVLTNSTPLGEGTYDITVIATDAAASPNNISTPITITVTTIDIPLWNPQPVDQTIEFGEGLSYTVNADSAVGIEQYWINDTDNFQIDPNIGLITEGFSALMVGEYWLEVSVNNTAGNENSAAIKITVEDTIDPIWDPIPKDQTIVFGDSFNYDVNAEDLAAPLIYSINDTANFQIDPHTGVISNNSDLVIGEYWLEIVAQDAHGNEESVIIKITVEEPLWVPPFFPIFRPPTEGIPGYPTLLLFSTIAAAMLLVFYFYRRKLRFRTH
ncbi:MAG: hypothetical protein BAJALOKI1v1_40024 [Promethearchaeota archaeon]|nr:MAG: hypothetical protein BAJALOKI1v1_40024 [Candidatus Lokiarchaeota archaeon]